MSRELPVDILSDITVHMKYAKYLPKKKRRETWKELVNRNMRMHTKKYPELKSEIEQVYKKYNQAKSRSILYIYIYIYI